MMPKTQKQKVAKPTSKQQVLKMLRASCGAEYAQECVSELMLELGVESLDDIQFGYGATPYGKRTMAGVKTAHAALTHFFDKDDGWQKMPVTYFVDEGLQVEGARKVRITVGQLKSLLKESLIFEEEEVTTKPSEEGNDSLDSQVDRYLADYESEAKSSKNEGLDFRMMTRRIMNEAEGDEDASDESGAEDATTEEPQKLSLDDIDVESFANSVARLVDNYDSLLEVKNTLVRRAQGFLAKTYDPDVVESFERLMREEHGIVPGKSKQEVEADEFPAPAAARAGEGGGAGGGAGV